MPKTSSPNAADEKPNARPGEEFVATHRSYIYLSVCGHSVWLVVALIFVWFVFATVLTGGHRWPRTQDPPASRS